MHNPIPSCFRGGVAAVTPPASTGAGPRVTSSVYETELGLAALTWSRTALGLSLHVDLCLPSPGSPSSSSTSSAASSVSFGESAEWTDVSFRFHVRPWLFCKRSGSKRFHLKGQHHRDHSVVDCAWDLARARFRPGGGPEPTSRFFVAVAVDGEMLLVVGDMEAEAYKKTKASRNTIPPHPPKKCNPALIFRREHVVLPSSGRLYSTRAWFGGKEREISIDLGGADGEEAKLCLGMDGERVLHVKRLRWKFRGNEEVEAEGGARVQVSWDVHRWLFAGRTDPSPPAAALTSESGHAVLLFRFDREEVEEEGIGACHDRHRRSSTVLGVDQGGRMLGLHGVGGFCSSGRGSIGVVGGSKTVGKKRSLLKTISSSSSSSSASSGSSSSVMEWARAEEGELQGSDTFSLLVNVWKR